MAKEKKYYKVTNEDECHYGFQYKDGLNILTEPFDDNPLHSCCKGGFYFTIDKYINHFYECGVWLREVFLPIDNPNFKMIKDSSGNKLRSNMIILGKKYNLLNIDDVKYILKNINSNIIEIVANLSGNGCIDTLELLKNSEFKFQYNESALYRASKYGHVNVLKWLQKSFCVNGKKFGYYEFAITYACAGGHVDVLDFLKISMSNFKCTKESIEMASLKGHLNVLKWIDENN